MDSAEAIADLQRRLRQLEDEREIRYLIGRYGHYADLGHEQAWAEQWTEDGVYDLVTVQRGGAGYAEPMRFEGKAELIGMIQDPAAHKLFEGRSLHLQDFNLVIRVDGDEAVAHGYSMTMLREGEGIQIRSAGMVRWRFRREAGKWRIAEKHRRNVGDGSGFTETPAIPAHAAARPSG